MTGSVWFAFAAWWAAGLLVVVERIVRRRSVRAQAKEAAGFLFGFVVVVVFWPAAYIGPWLDKRLYERRRRRRRARR